MLAYLCILNTHTYVMCCHHMTSPFFGAKYFASEYSKYKWWSNIGLVARHQDEYRTLRRLVLWRNVYLLGWSVIKLSLVTLEVRIISRH